MHLTGLDYLLAYSPAGPLNIGGDVPAAAIPFEKRLFAQTLNSLSSRPGRPNPAMLIVLDRCKCTAFGIGSVVDLISVAQGIGESGIAVFSCRVI